MRYHLRTLLIVLALGPPVLAGVWFCLPPATKPPDEPPILFSPHRPDLINYRRQHPSKFPY